MEKFFELVEEVGAKEVHHQWPMFSSPTRTWTRFSATAKTPNGYDKAKLDNGIFESLRDFGLIGDG